MHNKLSKQNKEAGSMPVAAALPAARLNDPMGLIMDLNGYRTIGARLSLVGSNIKPLVQSFRRPPTRPFTHRTLFILKQQKQQKTSHKGKKEKLLEIKQTWQI
jgi:hypothetical protein